MSSMKSETRVEPCCKGHERLKPQYLERRENVDARLVDLEMEKRNETSRISQVFDHMKAGVDVVSGLGNDTMDAGKHVASAISSRFRKLSLSMSDSVKQTAKDTANWVQSNVLPNSSNPDMMKNDSQEEKLSVVIHHSLHGEAWKPDELKMFSAAERAQERVAKRKSSEENPNNRLFIVNTCGIVEAVVPEQQMVRDGLSITDEGFSEAPAGEYQDEGEDPELSSMPPAPTSSPNPGEFIPQRFTCDAPTNVIHPRPIVSGRCVDADDKLKEVNDWFNKSEAQASTFTPFTNPGASGFMPAPHNPTSLTSSTVSVAGSTSSTGTSPQPHQKDCRTMLRQEDHMWGVNHNQIGPID